MKKILILVLFGSSMFALERTSFNLKAPSALENHMWYCDIFHRMKGKFDIENGTLGIGSGANIGLGLRYRVWKSLDLSGLWIKDNKEYMIGAGYMYHLTQAKLRSQVDIQYFTYANANQSSGRSKNFFYTLLVQTDPLLKFFVPTVNLGYDGYNQKIGLGVGGDFQFNVTLGPIESISLTGEYFPMLDKENNNIKNSMAFGIKINTFMHQFMLLVQNSSVIGPRRMMLGAPNNDFHIGFVMNRFQLF